jgi:adenosylhomocysteine nucleosidase
MIYVSIVSESIAIVYALREELKPLLKEGKILAKILLKPAVLQQAEFRGKNLVFCQTGVGMNLAHEGVEKLLSHFQPTLILSVGYAGATHPELKTGDLLFANEIRSEAGDRFDVGAMPLLEQIIREEQIPYRIGPLLTLWKMADRETKKNAGQSGALAVDMETAAAAAVAAKKEIPLLSLRAVFDTVDDELPFLEGTADENNPLSFLVKNPKAILSIPKFFRMNQICQKNLAKVISRFVDCYR